VQASSFNNYLVIQNDEYIRFVVSHSLAALGFQSSDKSGVAFSIADFQSFSTATSGQVKSYVLRSYHV